MFRLDGRTVDVLADRTRALPVGDPHDRQLIISCGCALFEGLPGSGTAMCWLFTTGVWPLASVGRWSELVELDERRRGHAESHAQSSRVYRVGSTTWG